MNPNMNGSSGYSMDAGYEYSVPVTDPDIRRKRILSLCGILLVFLSVYLIIANFVAYGALFFPMLICLIPILGGLLWFALRFLSSEVEYVLHTDRLTVSEIFGHSVRRLRLDIPVSACIEIAPYTDETPVHIEAIHPAKDYRLYASLDSETLCYAVINDEDEISVLYFDPDERLATLLCRKNPAATKELSRFFRERRQANT